MSTNTAKPTFRTLDATESERLIALHPREALHHSQLSTVLLRAATCTATRPTSPEKTSATSTRAPARTSTRGAGCTSMRPSTTMTVQRNRSR